MPKLKSSPVFVPEAEQPYQIPQNWRWTTLDTVAEWGSGGTPSRKIPEYYGGDIPWVKTGELDDGYIFDTEEKITTEAVAHSSAKLYPPNTVLIAMYGATIGKVAMLGISATTNQACACAKCRCFLLPLYLFYYLRLEKENFIKKAKGAAQPNISQDVIKKHAIPLPPLAEQQRIVERIEGLFSKLDAARENAQSVLDGAATRKAAILHRAFSGELTRQWRETRNDNGDSWKALRFADVAEVKSNLVNPLDFPDYPHIAPDNIEKRTGVLLDYRTISEDGVTSAKHLFHAGQILYSKIRPYLSKVVMVDFDGLCSADMYPIEPKEGFDVVYLWYYMLSDEFLYQASTAGSRSLLPKINQKELSAINIRVTDIDEQREIVAILNSVFEKERPAKSMAELVIKQIDAMKKVILGRAFRGELGTNRPSEAAPEAL